MASEEISLQKLQEYISPEFTQSVVTSIIQQAVGAEKADEVAVESIRSRGSAVRKGDSFLSDVLRINIKGTYGRKESWKDFDIPFFIKCIPRNVVRQKTFHCVNFFRNEIAFYSKVWPKMLSFQQSKHVQDEVPIVPRCFATHCDGKTDFIILEDLCENGFSPALRQEGCDAEISKIIIETIAKFHAISLAYRHQNPKEFAKLGGHLEENYASEKLRSWVAGFLEKVVFVAGRDAVQKELSSSYHAKFEKFVENFYRSLCTIASSTATFPTITQGDSWSPNFMLKVSGKGKATGAVMLDYQIARCSSPCIDLAMFMYSSISLDIRESKWNEHLKFYYNTVIRRITELGSPDTIFKWADFLDDFKKCALFGIGQSMESMPFMFLEDCESPDLDQMPGQDAVPLETIMCAPSIESPDGRKRLAYAIKHAIDNDYI